MKALPTWLTRLALTVARLLLMLVVFFPLGQMIIQNWRAVRAVLVDMDWISLVWPMLLLGIVLPWMSSISWASLRSLGISLPARQVFGLYFITQLPKYLPGGVWAFPGRMLAYQVAGVQAIPAVVSVFREVSALFLGAVLVGGVALFRYVVLDPALQSALLIGLLVCLGVTASLQLRVSWRLLARLPLVKNSRLAKVAVQEHPDLFRLAWLPGALVCSLSFWLAIGLPFQQLMVAISPVAASISWLEAAMFFALSWSVGFVVIFVPAGFGVRESALTLLLSSILPLGEAVSIALLSRLWWMAVEAVCIAISVWWLRDLKGLDWKQRVHEI